MPIARELIRKAYRLISAGSPTVPLKGDDLSLGLETFNELLEYYAATGLMLTIAKTVSFALPAGQGEVVYGPATFLPVPDVTNGRLANLNSAWLDLSGTIYPLIDKSRDVFLESYKYDPLTGLPRFVVVFPEDKVTRLRLYPAPSTAYTLYVRGKFQAARVAVNDDLTGLPDYFTRFAYFAVARDVAFFKGRADAWTDKLETLYNEAKDVMEAASEVNLSITGDSEALLNGANRVRAGV